jgi:small-conductance mechanosensitive channel
MHLPDWLQRLSDLAVSWEVLETLIFQLAVIIAAFLPSWGFRAATRSRSDRLAQRIAAQFCWLRIPAELSGLVLFKGEVLLGLWDAFNEKGIELPIPQREVHIRDLSTTVRSRARESQAAHDKRRTRFASALQSRDC